MKKTLRLLTMFLLLGLVFAASASAAPKTYAVLPFKVTSTEQYKYLQVSVPQMISSRIYWKDHFQPVAKTTLSSQSAAAGESSAASAQNSMNGDYVIWGDILIENTDCTMNVFARDRSGKLWSRNVKTKVNALTPKLQEVSSSISSEVFGRKDEGGATVISSPEPQKETVRQLNPDLVHNESTPKDTYLNPQFRYAGNTGEGSIIRTPTLPFPSVDFAVYDLDGDGRTEVAVLEEKGLHVYRFEGGKLKELASDTTLPMLSVLSSRVWDDKKGRPKIIVNAQDVRGGGSTMVYVFDGKKLIQQAKSIPYYMNVVTLPLERRKILVGQYADVQRVFKPGIYEMVESGTTYTEGPRMEMPEGINALNFNWLPTKEGQDLIVSLSNQERLRVFSQKGTRMFETEETFSGGYVGIEQTNQIRGVGKDHNYIPDKYFIPQRLLVADLEKRGQYVLLVNKPVSTAAQFFDRYRFFPQGEIQALFWDGVGLNLLWKTRRIKGSVIDVALADFTNSGGQELVVGVNTHPGAVGMAQRKTMFLAYPLDLSQADPNTPPDQTEFIHNNAD